MVEPASKTTETTSLTLPDVSASGSAATASGEVARGPSAGAEQPSAVVDGWRINIPTLGSAVASIIGAAKREEGFSCLTLNLDHLVKLRNNNAFRAAYSAARFVTADGAPVAFMARRQWPEVERTTGADLLVPLCEAAADDALPVFLFGTSTEVLDRTALELSKKTGGRIEFAGIDAPAMGFDPEGPEADATIERIRASEARLCFVMLGAPKQELFAARAVAAGVKCGFICVGAAADFVSGEQARAPALLQKTGLEWAWRLSQEPGRLWRRYLSCALLLIRIETERLMQPMRSALRL